MRCQFCKCAINRGLEERKRAEYWRGPDGVLRVFGVGMPGGILARAQGTLVSCAHSRCYWNATKSAERHAGDAEAAPAS